MGVGGLSEYRQGRNVVVDRQGPSNPKRRRRTEPGWRWCARVPCIEGTRRSTVLAGANQKRRVGGGEYEYMDSRE